VGRCSHPAAGYARSMAYDEVLAERVRDLFGGAPDVVEKKMFGGVAFMVAGNMACGIIGDDLMVRVTRNDYDSTLALPHARQMDMTGRPMRGFVVVDAEGLAEDADLEQWVDRGVDFVRTLPPK
jgi:TfoX/Sxy family transcriptional regulator of competence genes